MFALAAASACAAQLDIHGPPGSVAFGTTVTVLPNGNIVVTDPDGPLSGNGAVYLYNPDGNLISTLSGSSSNDHVGDGGVVVIGNGNFVVVSSHWNNGAATQAGAVTWMSGLTGLGTSAVVSANNSLIGVTQDDQVGAGGVTALANGNYVVSSFYWNDGAIARVGAATWGNASSGVEGAVSADNSLVGTTTKDNVGRSVTALNNGNYVVDSYEWNNGTPETYVGAITWGNGASGSNGQISANNSLIGTTGGDLVGNGGVTALVNGNYVIASYSWNNGSPGSNVGAATWVNGAGGSAGSISTSNSLYGRAVYDNVSSGGITALSNGNYVVSSYDWNKNSLATQVGAVTWGNGTSGKIGAVSAGNSLVGSITLDNVGMSVTALSNGNYVVDSYYWNNGSPNASVGAATWGNGTIGTMGPVTTSNSLFGTTIGDEVGLSGVTALNNGNYVVASAQWNNGTSGAYAGAATWGNGSSGSFGAVSADNSLVGTTSDDQVGVGGIAALSNGNYVVASRDWNNGTSNSKVGAATWGNGAGGSIGPVSASNSLVGTTNNDQVSSLGVTVLASGKYVVTSPYWNNGSPNAKVGATTWGNGSSGIIGSVSPGNSLIGTTVGDFVGNNGISGVTALVDNYYLVKSTEWNNGATYRAGAVTLANGNFRLKGSIQPWNSVLGMVADAGPTMIANAKTYDATRHRLAVGRPAENIVSLFTSDQLFADNFEP